MPGPTHKVFTVRPPEHEASDPARSRWRAIHAHQTVEVVGAWFDHDNTTGYIAQAADGSFLVHAPLTSTLATVRQMLTEHEGMVIVAESEAPGLGILPLRSTGEG